MPARVRLNIIKNSGAQPSTYYVDAAAGNDSNDGRSAGRAWQTIVKVKAGAYKPGDNILFKRGGTWSGTGANASLAFTSLNGKPGLPITFGAYGSGTNPIIDRTDQYSIYMTTCSYVRFMNIDGTNAQNNYRIADSHDIEINGCDLKATVADDSSINLLPSSDAACYNIKIQNVTIHETPGWGITSGAYYNDNLVIKNCTITGIAAGGSVEHHGIYLQACRNLLVDRCTITTPANSGFRLSAASGKNITGVIQNTKVTNPSAGGVSGAAMEFDRITGTLTVQNCVFAFTTLTPLLMTLNNASSGINLYNNTIVEGYAGLYLMAGCTGWNIKNNLFVQDYAYTANNNRNCIQTASDTIIVNNTFNRNLYYFKNGGGSLSPLRSGSSNLTLAQWQAKTGSPDANSLSADPVFVTSYSNLHIQTTSPAKAAGDTSLGVAYDYDGNPRGAAVDIGAFEYVA